MALSLPAAVSSSQLRKIHRTPLSIGLLLYVNGGVVIHHATEVGSHLLLAPPYIRETEITPHEEFCNTSTLVVEAASPP